jgi:hypothetical protein
MNDSDELKTGYLCDADTIASNCPLFLKRRKIGVELAHANLIRVAPECRDTSRVAYMYHGTFGRSVYSQK